MSIKINHLTHVYNPGTAFEKVALDDVTLEIQKGEFIGLIGHTGSGKSTLIQHLNGIISPKMCIRDSAARLKSQNARR